MLRRRHSDYLHPDSRLAGPRHASRRPASPEYAPRARARSLDDAAYYASVGPGAYWDPDYAYEYGHMRHGKLGHRDTHASFRAKEKAARRAAAAGDFTPEYAAAAFGPQYGYVAERAWNDSPWYGVAPQQALMVAPGYGYGTSEHREGFMAKMYSRYLRRHEKATRGTRIGPATTTTGHVATSRGPLTYVKRDEYILDPDYAPTRRAPHAGANVAPMAIPATDNTPLVPTSGPLASALGTSASDATLVPQHHARYGTGVTLLTARGIGGRLVHPAAETWDDVVYAPPGTAAASALPRGYVGKGGTLEAVGIGAAVPLSAKQAVPYSGFAVGGGDAGVLASGTRYHAESGFGFAPALTERDRGYAASTYTTSSTLRGGAGGVRGTTLSAIDRANLLALQEAEASRVRSITKVGPITIDHDNPRYARERRARVLSSGPRDMTTTEAAVVRADSIAAAEARSEGLGRRAVTKVGAMSF